MDRCAPLHSCMDSYLVLILSTKEGRGKGAEACGRGGGGRECVVSVARSCAACDERNLDQVQFLLTDARVRPVSVRVLPGEKG
jgi:hypothetical protein